MIRKDFREILSAELISVIGGLAAGLLLAFATNQIELIPGLLILLPGFLEMRGNISGSLSARLSSGLIVGAIKPEVANQRIVKGNVTASIILSVFLSLLLGVVAFFSIFLFFQIINYKIIFIALIAGVLSNLIEIPLTIITVFWLFSHGHDPNNIMGPYVTTTGDIISVVSLLVAMVVI